VGQIDDPARGIDGGYGSDLLLAERLANDIETARERAYRTVQARLAGGCQSPRN